MKKFILFIGLVLSLIPNAQADDNTTFSHPIFYQQLSDANNNYFYVLKPNSMYYENSKTEVTQSARCILQENQEYFVKMLCNGCNNSECSSYIKNIHTFYLSKNKTADNHYVISHKIYDELGLIKFEETLTNDGLITIPPYQ